MRQPTRRSSASTTAATPRGVAGAVAPQLTPDLPLAHLSGPRLPARPLGARDRKSLRIGRRTEGRRSYVERDPELARHARQLTRPNPHTGKARPLRQIAAELAEMGYVTGNGTPFNATQVRRLVKGKTRPPRDGVAADTEPEAVD